MATFNANALQITDLATGNVESVGTWSFDSSEDLQTFMDSMMSSDEENDDNDDWDVDAEMAELRNMGIL